MSAHDDLVSAISRRAQAAGESRWLGIGQVTATGATYTVTLDGATLTGLHKCSAYATPAVSDVVLVAIIRGVTSVQHLIIDKLT